MTMEIIMATIFLGLIISGGIKVTIGDVNIGNGRKKDQDK
jgi:hypothetical protein